MISSLFLFFVFFILFYFVLVEKTLHYEVVIPPFIGHIKMKSIQFYYDVVCPMPIWHLKR